MASLLLLRRPLPSFSPIAHTAKRTFATTPATRIAKMTIVGRLAAEPELTATSTGQEMVKYAVGTSYGPKDNKQTSWFRVASFDEGPRRDYLLGLGKGYGGVKEGPGKDGEGRAGESGWIRVTAETSSGSSALTLFPPRRTLIYVEGDASMRQYDDSEGKRQSALSITQRNIEVLKRPEPKPEGQ
ncbi:MAG: ssDNA-binding protein, mitochondrial [Pleopsidium flavum]|nr:MAG: ssDNA-binding protein, mitochondrial [Pleopsidium flavum]